MYRKTILLMTIEAFLYLSACPLYSIHVKSHRRLLVTCMQHWARTVKIQEGTMWTHGMSGEGVINAENGEMSYDFYWRVKWARSDGGTLLPHQNVPYTHTWRAPDVITERLTMWPSAILGGAHHRNLGPWSAVQSQCRCRIKSSPCSGRDQDKADSLEESKKSKYFPYRCKDQSVKVKLIIALVNRYYLCTMVGRMMKRRWCLEWSKFREMYSSTWSSHVVVRETWNESNSRHL